MKSNKFVTLILTVMLFTFLSIAVFAASKNISVNGDIKISIDGKEFIPKDANGNTVEVFEYNGTTYVPIRAIATAFGKDVGYDAGSRTAVIKNIAPISFGAGKYIVGEDIAPGKYDVKAVSGFGNFMGSVASCQLGSLNEILAAEGSNDYYKNCSTYNNLRLEAGDSFTIGGDLKLEFTSK